MAPDTKLDSEPFLRWQLPSIEHPAVTEPDPPVAREDSAPPANAEVVDDTDDDKACPEAISREEIEAIRASAIEDGFAVGHREGLARAESEVAEQASRLTALLAALTEPLDALDREIESSLVRLVTDIARHLVRRELSIQPEQIVSVLREALSMLPVNEQRICIHLHPDDAHLVEALLHLEDRPWRIEENPLLSRGGCRVSTEVSQIDATVEHRIGEIIARVLGDQRRGPETMR